MSVYTTPALNAVDFALTATTPANITPYTIALSPYTPPATSAVDFALTTFTAPTFQDVGWDLLAEPPEPPDPPDPPDPPEPTQGFAAFLPHRRQLKPAIDKLNERRKKKKDKRNIALLLLMSDF